MMYLKSKMALLADFAAAVLATPVSVEAKNSRHHGGAEHLFGTLKMRTGATHFLMKRLPKVATEIALHVLAYNLTRVMNIMGSQPLIAPIRA